MDDLLTALALLLVLEGLLYAAFPDGMKRMIAQLLEVPGHALRAAGLAAAVVGIACLWLLRG
ncbi:MAG: DUF2065 family protein [Rhodospirillaceae bacterium]|nr:DUF2065 family protein [Rhodospirillaceae bacterium]